MVKVQIFKNNLIKNFEKIKTFANGKQIFAVVKSNAYGLGIVKVANALSSAGADGFCVNSVSEAKKILHLNKRILVLLQPEFLIDSQKVEYVVGSFDVLQKIENFATEKNMCAHVHIKINCGMNRLGFDECEIANILEKISASKNLKLVGVCTHFSYSHGKKLLKQELKFNQLLKQDFLEKIITENKLDVHCYSSYGIINNKLNLGNCARVGIAIYGGINGFLPVAKVGAKVLQIRTLNRGKKISYDGITKIKRNTKIAIISIGYASGMPQNFAKHGFIIVNNSLCKILGKICMNMAIVDVTRIKCKVGDSAWFLNKKQTVINVSKKCKKSCYEILTSLKK